MTNRKPLPDGANSLILGAVLLGPMAAAALSVLGAPLWIAVIPVIPGALFPLVLFAWCAMLFTRGKYFLGCIPVAFIGGLLLNQGAGMMAVPIFYFMLCILRAVGELINWAMGVAGYRFAEPN